MVSNCVPTHDVCLNSSGYLLCHVICTDTYMYRYLVRKCCPSVRSFISLVNFMQSFMLLALSSVAHPELVRATDRSFLLVPPVGGWNRPPSVRIQEEYSHTTPSDIMSSVGTL